MTFLPRLRVDMRPLAAGPEAAWAIFAASDLQASDLTDAGTVSDTRQHDYQRASPDLIRGPR